MFLRQVLICLAFFILRFCLSDEIHYLSTGEDPEVFVRNKINSHDVSSLLLVGEIWRAASLK